MKKRAYTDEMINFLSANIDNYSWSELTKLFNENFLCKKNDKNIMRLCSRSGLKKDQRHYYAKNKIKKIRELPEEMLKILRANFEDVSHEELTKRFNSRFNLKKKTYDLKNYCTKYGLRKSDPYKAHPLRLPVGYESRRTGMGGWTYVKVDNENWKAKHRFLWEQAHGPIPKGHFVIFADGNIDNFDIENLVLVTRSEFLSLSHSPLKLLHTNAELRQIAINIAKIKTKIASYNKACG